MTIGFFGLNPGQSVQRNEMWPSLIGVLHDKSALAKRLAKASFGIPSTIEMHRLPVMVATLCGGTIEAARIRPREGSS